jgi:hypothetical protein
MSDFFDWLGEYVPLGVMLTVWAVVAPLRLVVMLILPFSARRTHHFLNPIYEFVAFEQRF